MTIQSNSSDVEHGWQPIASAPFETLSMGDKWLEWCLLWVPDAHGGFPIVGGMDSDMWLWRDDHRACGEFTTEPTHWMPLPLPPASPPATGNL